MSNLKDIYQNDPEKYKEAILKLSKELKLYYATVEDLYLKNKFDELKYISHTIRNIAGSIGQSKLKIMAAYWEDICLQKESGDIHEFKQAMEEVLTAIQQEKLS